MNVKEGKITHLSGTLSLGPSSPRENWYWGGWECAQWPSCLLQDLSRCLVSKCREIRAWKRSTSQTIWLLIQSRVKRSRVIICSEDYYKGSQPLIWQRKSLLFRQALQCNEETEALEVFLKDHPIHFPYNVSKTKQNTTKNPNILERSYGCWNYWKLLPAKG